MRLSPLLLVLVLLQHATWVAHAQGPEANCDECVSAEWNNELLSIPDSPLPCRDLQETVNDLFRCPSYSADAPDPSTCDEFDAAEICSTIVNELNANYSCTGITAVRCESIPVFPPLEEYVTTCTNDVLEIAIAGEPTDPWETNVGACMALKLGPDETFGRRDLGVMNNASGYSCAELAAYNTAARDCVGDFLPSCSSTYTDSFCPDVLLPRAQSESDCPAFSCSDTVTLNPDPAAPCAFLELLVTRYCSSQAPTAVDEEEDGCVALDLYVGAVKTCTETIKPSCAALWKETCETGLLGDLSTTCATFTCNDFLHDTPSQGLKKNVAVASLAVGALVFLL